MAYKEGSKGAIVAQIQKAIGCYADGIWGKITTESLKAWQREHGLTADGIAGPATLAKMGLAKVTPSVSRPEGVESVTGSYGLTLRRSKRQIQHIIVHCTATREGQAKTVQDIRREHRAQGWADIGYHYVVTLEGKVCEGRNVDIAGAHAEGYNARSIGVVYVGGVENRPGVEYKRLRAKDTRTPAQKFALRQLLCDLRKLYPYARIISHRDVDKKGKECPSFDATKEYQDI